MKERMMGFLNKFTNSSETPAETEADRRAKERAVRREKSKTKRRVEGTIFDTKYQIERLEKKNEANWARARKLMLEGDVPRAKIMVMKYRLFVRLVEKQQKKKALLEDYLMRVENAETDVALADAFGRYAALIDVDPAKIEEELSKIAGHMENIDEVQRIIADVYREPTPNLTDGDMEGVPSLDELMKQLSFDVTLENGGKAPVGQTVADSATRTSTLGHEAIDKELDAAENR